MKPNHKNRILLARLSFPLATLLATTSVHADQTWDGGSATDSFWNTPANWGGDAIPTFGSAITFTGNTRNSAANDLNANPTIGGILFTNNGDTDKTNAFTLSGNAITLGGNITTTANTAGSTITDMISLNMILNGTRTITTNIQSGTGVQHNLSISGNITEDVAGRSLTKGGSGILTLSGTNNYSGTTTVNNAGGTLRIDAASALPSGSQINLSKSGSSTGTLLMNTSGVNVYNNTFGNFSASFTTVVGGPATIRNAQGDNTFIGNMNISAAGGTGVILQSDAGTLRIAGNLTNTNTGSFRLFEFAGAGNSVFSGQANDTSGTTGVALLKSGAGTLSITGTNSNFTGNTTLLQGVLNVASVADTGTNSSIGAGGAITLSGQGTSGTFQYTGSTAVTTNRALNVAATGGTLDASGTGSGTLKFTGTFTSTDTAAAAFNLNFTNGSAVATNTTSAAPGTVGGNVMTVANAGLPAGTTIASISGNSYTLSNPFTGTTGAVSTTFGTVARTLTLTGSNAGTNEISSTLANSSGGGVLGINKTGEGAWILSGTNSYTGATNVQGGTLVINGNISTSVSLTVAPSATLGGIGTVGSATISGILAPGSGIGTLTAEGDVTWNANNAWAFGLGAASVDLEAASFGSDNDLLRIAAGGDFLKGSGSAYTFDFANTGAAGVYKLVDWADTTDFAGTDFLATNLPSGLTGTFTVDSGTTALYLNVIPEPSTALLGTLGALALLRRRREVTRD